MFVGELNDGDFARQLTRLTETFGPKFYTAVRVSLIKGYAKGLNPAKFEQIVTKFIATHRTAPTPSEFEKACLMSKYENKRTSAAETGGFSQPTFLCETCFDTGVVQVKKINDPSNKLKFLHCVCEEGKKQEYGFPAWDAELFVDWKLHCDWSFWKPKEGVKGINKKIEHWKQAIKLSQKFWS